jgi:hypothetical protein
MQAGRLCDSSDLETRTRFYSIFYNAGGEWIPQGFCPETSDVFGIQGTGYIELL